jgi:hypothetical protein
MSKTALNVVVRLWEARVMGAEMTEAEIVQHDVEVTTREYSRKRRKKR